VSGIFRRSRKNIRRCAIAGTKGACPRGLVFQTLERGPMQGVEASRTLSFTITPKSGLGEAFEHSPPSWNLWEGNCGRLGDSVRSCFQQSLAGRRTTSAWMKARPRTPGFTAIKPRGRLLLSALVAGDKFQIQSQPPCKTIGRDTIFTQRWALTTRWGEDMVGEGKRWTGAAGMSRLGLGNQMDRLTSKGKRPRTPIPVSPHHMTNKNPIA